MTNTDEKTVRATFPEIFAAHHDYVSDKWEHYLAIYESEIGPLISSGNPINLLEIGVQNGGSLQIWSKYLPRGSQIVGIDINEDIKKLVFPENVKFICGDASDPKIVDLIPNIKFDVVIDDGSHISRDVINSFGTLFGKLIPGGKYIIEDMQASYDPHYGGGFRSGQSSVDWAKGFIDAINSDHISDLDRLNAGDGEILREIGRLLWRVSFYDSVAVFHALKTPKEGPFRRLFAGKSAAIMDPLDWTPNVDAHVFASIGFNESMYRRIDAELVARSQSLQAREANLKKLIDDISNKISSLSEANAKIRNLLVE